MTDRIQSSTIHLALAFDQNYYNQFFALASSIFHHHQRGEITFHVIATGISAPNLNHIKAYVNQYGSQISFYKITDLEVSKLVLINTWTSSVYYRLYFSFVLPPIVTRFLYLDMDTIVVNPLYDLWEMNLDLFPVAAVYDNYVKSQPLLGIHEEGEYFNSGVLLINRTLWNQQRISEKTIDFLKTNPDKIRYVDQCGLNAVLKKKWFKLNPKYNFIYSFVPPAASKYELKELLKEIVIIHYTLQRPWNMLCRNRLAHLYFHYLKLSPIGHSTKRITDFTFGKIPEFIRIKLLNTYFDLPLLSSFWRKIKKTNHAKTIGSKVS